MSDWFRGVGGHYKLAGYRVDALVVLGDEWWSGEVYVDGQLVSKGEWSGRDDALNATKARASHACFLRRFEKNPPLMPDGDDDDDDDGEEDDDD